MRTTLIGTASLFEEYHYLSHSWNARVKAAATATFQRFEPCIIPEQKLISALYTRT